MGIQLEAGAAQFCTSCGSRLENGACPMPHAPARAQAPSARRPRRMLPAVLGSSLAVVIVVALVLVALLRSQVSTLDGRVQAQQAAEKQGALGVDRRIAASIAAANAATNGLAQRVGALEAKANNQPNPTAVAAKVRASVFVIETDAGLGSAWALSSSGGTSTLVTNFHVIADTWSNGGRTVQVKQKDAVWTGTITQVDIPGDLALITTPEAFPVLARATAVPQIGASVLVVGAPLGLDDTVTNGIVSARRTEAGKDYLQFSAPISPGNSGGPVVDARGRVVGIAEAKLVGDNAEGLSLAVPVARICTGLHIC